MLETVSAEVLPSEPTEKRWELVQVMSMTVVWFCARLESYAIVIVEDRDIAESDEC